MNIGGGKGISHCFFKECSRSDLVYRKGVGNGERRGFCHSEVRFFQL